MGLKHVILCEGRLKPKGHTWYHSDLGHTRSGRQEVEQRTRAGTKGLVVFRGRETERHCFGGEELLLFGVMGRWGHDRGTVLGLFPNTSSLLT